MIKMTKYTFLLSCLICLVTSCKSINLTQSSQTTTTQQVHLGSIGLDKDFILQTQYNTAAIPSYKSPIKVAVSLKGFTKSSYKTFIKASRLQSVNVDVRYVDSIAVKPTYLQIDIADKITLVSALNTTENTSVKDYLKNNPSANIVTSISIACNYQDLEAITKADAVFLVESSLKTYALQLYKDRTKTQLIKFNQGVIFGYKTAYCCWQENNRRTLDIVDLVDDQNSCPNTTFRKASRAKKKIDYLKL